MHEAGVVVQAQPEAAAQLVESYFEVQVPKGVPVQPAAAVSDQVQPVCAAQVVELLFAEQERPVPVHGASFQAQPGAVVQLAEALMLLHEL